MCGLFFYAIKDGPSFFLPNFTSVGNIFIRMTEYVCNIHDK